MQFTHLDKHGNAIMVDVSDKEKSKRIAIASGTIKMNEKAFLAIKNNTTKKGDVIMTARIAAIMGAKKTSDIIPLCHPLSISKVSVDFSFIEEQNKIKSKVYTTCVGKTGVEMEALTACSISLLTIYDMIKAIDKSPIISDIKLELKDGGKTGLYERKNDR